MDPAATATAAVEVTSVAKSMGGSSFLGMFFQASLAVKLVMLVLATASFWSWTIIFAKLTHFRRLKSCARRFEEAFWSGSSLEVLFDRIGANPEDPFSSVFAAAMREWKRASSKGTTQASFEVRLALKERVERVMTLTAMKEVIPVERGLSFLATVSSSSPFIGLFGMVWGVMTSFESISIEQNTNLAAVMPGIAEALFTTALGLLACIPAAIAYNKFTHEVESYVARLDHFIEEFLVILSRQIEDNQSR